MYLTKQWLLHIHFMIAKQWQLYTMTFLCHGCLICLKLIWHFLPRKQFESINLILILNWNLPQSLFDLPLNWKQTRYRCTSSSSSNVWQEIKIWWQRCILSYNLCEWSRYSSCRPFTCYTFDVTAASLPDNFNSFFCTSG